MSDAFNRLQLLIAKGILTLAKVGGLQVKVLDEEVLENIEHAQPYGFKYAPLPGAVPYLVFPSGDRSYGIALVVGDDRYTLQLAEGEVALHDHNGQYVHLKAGGIVAVKATSKVIADAPNFETTGNAKIGGSLQVGGGITASGSVQAASVTSSAPMTAPAFNKG